MKNKKIFILTAFILIILLTTAFFTKSYLNYAKWDGNYGLDLYTYDTNGIGSYERLKVIIKISEKDETLHIDIQATTYLGHTQGTDVVTLQAISNSADIAKPLSAKTLSFSMHPFLADETSTIYVELQKTSLETIAFRYSDEISKLADTEFVYLKAQ